MRSLGYTAEAFASADDSLASPRLAATACVIADVHMPAMNRGGTPPTPHRGSGCAFRQILVTAYPNDVDRARVLERRGRLLPSQAG